MKKLTSIIYLLASILLVSSLSSCDNAICISAESSNSNLVFSFDPITSLDISSSATVFVTQDAVQSVSITAPQNVLDRLDIEESNGELKVGLDGCFSNSFDFEILISIPSSQALRSIDLSGSSVLSTTNAVVFEDDFQLSASGSSNADLIIANAINEADISFSGSSSGSLSGQGRSIKASLSGSSLLRAFDYLAVTGNIDLQGSSEAEVFVDGGILQVSASGSSVLKYKGTPSDIDSSLSGSSEIVNRN
ncbi:MAG: DUF2807 domain-containing protein [Bacteroidota bacterium]